jgi:hypothetical protein
MTILMEQFNELAMLIESDLLAKLAKDAATRKKKQLTDDPAARRILAWLDSLGDPITIYRELMLSSGEKPNMQALGRYWSADKKAATSPHGRIDGKGRHPILLTGTVRRDDVDERETVATFKRYPGEREVRLKQGAKIKVKNLGVGYA